MREYTEDIHSIINIEIEPRVNSGDLRLRDDMIYEMRIIKREIISKLNSIVNISTELSDIYGDESTITKLIKYYSYSLLMYSEKIRKFTYGEIPFIDQLIIDLEKCKNLYDLKKMLNENL